MDPQPQAGSGHDSVTSSGSGSGAEWPLLTTGEATALWLWPVLTLVAIALVLHYWQPVDTKPKFKLPSSVINYGAIDQESPTEVSNLFGLAPTPQFDTHSLSISSFRLVLAISLEKKSQRVG